MSKEQYKKQIAQAKEDAWPQTAQIRGCATCENLTDEGQCSVLKEYPPLEFIVKDNSCDKYEQRIPF